MPPTEKPVPCQTVKQHCPKFQRAKRLPRVQGGRPQGMPARKSSSALLTRSRVISHNNHDTGK